MSCFALVDCNSFFCSCERVINPSLNGKPVIVLSNNDGVVVSRTPEAKALGINWDAFHLIQDLIKQHHVQYFSSNYGFYKEMSGRVMQTLGQFTPSLEHYSVDEAFLDLRGISNRDAYAREIQRTIMQWTGIPVSIGLGSTRTLAKVANRLAKKSPKTQGVLDLTDSPFLDLALSRTNIEDVWGIGRRWSEHMNACGLTTALALRNANHEFLLQRFNNTILMRTVAELQGVSCIPPIAAVSSKSIMSTMSFGRYVETLDEMKQSISMHVSQAAAKMRREGLMARQVSLFIRTNKHRTQSPQYRNSIELALPFATDLTSEILEWALAGLKQIFQEGYLYNKAGVNLSSLSPASEQQINWLDPIDRTRMSHLMAAVDNINMRYGTGTLRYAVEGFQKPWRMRRNFLSDDGGKSKILSEYQQMTPVNELGTSLPVVRTM